MGRRRATNWIFGALVAVAVAGGGALFGLVFFLNDSTTPISVEDVVESFRADDVGDLDEVPPSSLPQPGVYMYATSGDEGIDALGGTRHAYPDITTVIVQLSDCGATYQWAPLEERTQEWELCRSEAGLRLTGYSSFHQFFGQDDRRVLTCEAPVLMVPSEPVVGQVSDGACSGRTLREAWSVTVASIATEVVDGIAVEVVVVTVAIDVAAIDDSTSGTYASSYTLAMDSGLLVRWEQLVETVADSPVGSVVYDEGFTIELSSVEPRT